MAIPIVRLPQAGEFHAVDPDEKSANLRFRLGLQQKTAGLDVRDQNAALLLALLVHYAARTAGEAKLLPSVQVAQVVDRVGALADGEVRFRDLDAHALIAELLLVVEVAVDELRHAPGGHDEVDVLGPARRLREVESDSPTDGMARGW